MIDGASATAAKNAARKALIDGLAKTFARRRHRPNDPRDGSYFARQMIRPLVSR